MPMTHKAGYVNIIGEPNAGKSTLLNQIVGEQLAVISPKAQTTRHRILGIVNDDNTQVVISDTPGLLDPSYRLQEAMMGFVHEALDDADVFLLVADAQNPEFNHSKVLEKINSSGVPVVIAINKIDIVGQEEAEKRISEWKKRLPNAEILAISALHAAGIESLLKLIREKLPDSPPYFPKDQLTDRPERFFVSEIIRGKILDNFSQEIPYSVEIVVDSFQDKPDIISIRAFILVMRESQKPIIIGKGGALIKKVGTQARQDIEKFLGKKVFLDLQVKVAKNWREDPMQLKRFGYNKG